MEKLKLGCKLSHLASFFYISTDAKIIQFIEGDEELLQKVGNHALCSRVKQTLKYLVFQRRSTSGNRLMLMLVIYVRTQYVKLCQQDVTILESLIWRSVIYYFDRTRPMTQRTWSISVFNA